MNWVSFEESDPADNWALLSESARFVLSPVMLPYTMGQALYDYMEGTSHLDHKETVRNTLMWTGAAVASWAYHAWMFPGQYAFTSGTTGYKVLFHTTPIAAPLALLAPGAGASVVHRKVVEAQPAEDQPAMWWTWIAALTGSGPGIGGYTGHVE